VADVTETRDVSRAYPLTMTLPERTRSTLSKVDDVALIAVAVVVGLILFKILGWIVGTLLFFVKLAVTVAVIYAIVRLASRSRAQR
jgi:hypothetical protein